MEKSSLVCWPRWNLCVMLVPPATVDVTLTSNLSPQSPTLLPLVQFFRDFWFHEALKVILSQVLGLCTCVLKNSLTIFLGVEMPFYGLVLVVV